MSMVFQRSGICVRSCDMIGGYVLVPSDIQILAVCAKSASSAPRRDGVSGLLVALVVTNDRRVISIHRGAVKIIPSSDKPEWLPPAPSTWFTSELAASPPPPLRLMGSKLETAGRQGSDASYPRLSILSRDR